LYLILQCPICLDPVTEDIATLLCCKNILHTSCLTRLYATNFNPRCPLCHHRPLATRPPINNISPRPILVPDSDDEDDDDDRYQQVRNHLIAHLLLSTTQSLPESDDLQITNQHEGTWLASANRQRPIEHVRDLRCLQQDNDENNPYVMDTINGFPQYSRNSTPRAPRSATMSKHR
jgi:hypothetical protein